MYRPARKGEAANDALLTKAVDNYKLASEKLTEETQPKRSLALEFLVAAYGPDKLNDPTLAEPVVKRMIELAPNEPTNYFQLAKIYEDSGEYELAEETYLKGRDARPNDPTVYMPVADFYNRQGDFEKLVENLRKRIELEPNNPEAHYTLATYYWDKASRDFRLSDKEKMQLVHGRPRRGRQGARDQARLHRGDDLQGPAAPPAGPGREGPEEAAGADSRGHGAGRQGQRDAQGARGQLA